MEHGISALVAGATGLVGRELVSLLTENDDAARVLCLVRRPVDVPAGARARVVNFDDLEHADPLMDVNAAFCALGTTIRTAGSEAEFRRVDLVYVRDFALLAARARVRSLVVISSVGADSRSGNFYLRTKGEMEDAVRGADIPSITFVRPSLLLGQRQESRPGERVAGVLLPLLSPLLLGRFRRYRPIRARDVARAMIAAAEEAPPGVHILHPGGMV